MGTIEFNSVKVYEGPLCYFKITDNWNDSMATYYPYVNIGYMESGYMVCKTLDVEGFYDPIYQSKLFKVLIDENMEEEMLLQEKLEKQRLEEERLDFNKTVRVVKGRKIPIGTEGEIVWMGFDSFGKKRVGLRLLDGKKVYTAATNVKVVTLEEATERFLLGMS